MKTGGCGSTWTEYSRPKPPAVKDEYAYWRDPPPQPSERCAWWAEQIARGWLPNRRWRTMGWSSAMTAYGVYAWEYLHVLSPLVDRAREIGRTYVAADTCASCWWGSCPAPGTVPPQPRCYCCAQGHPGRDDVEP